MARPRMVKLRRVPFNVAMAEQEAVRIEILAAEFSARIIVDREPVDLVFGEAAYDGWWTHRNGYAPVAGRWDGEHGRQYMAGWLARQICRHGQGDDSERRGSQTCLWKETSDP